MPKKNTLSVGQKLNQKRAVLLRPGDKVNYVSGDLREVWTVEVVESAIIQFKRPGSPVRWNTNSTAGWGKLTVKKLAKGVDRRTVTKLNGAAILRLHHRNEHLTEMNRNLIQQKADLRNRVLELENALRDIFKATDKLKSYQMAIVDAQHDRTTACGRGRALLLQ